VQRAFASYREVHDAYVPQLVIGSGLGKSYGFPLSIEGAAPALANAVVQSTVFNLSQRQLANAQRKPNGTPPRFQDKDQRNAVIQDVALTYAELAKWQARSCACSRMKPRHSRWNKPSPNACKRAWIAPSIEQSQADGGARASSSDRSPRLGRRPSASSRET
jgi:hypothetical protein